MKKRKLLFVFLMLVIGGLFFSSCSKDDKYSKKLNGTNWSSDYISCYSGEVIVNNVTHKAIIRSMSINFLEDECIIYTTFGYPGSSFDDQRSFKYSYKNSKYILTPKSEFISTPSYFGIVTLKEGDNLYQTFEATVVYDEMSIRDSKFEMLMLNTKTNESFTLYKH